MKTQIPDYKRIYKDILLVKFPEKIQDCETFMNKSQLSFLDVINLNKLIFGEDSSKSFDKFNQRHRSYDKSTILQILEFQKRKRLSNIQLAIHFKLSRNTIAGWKKKYY
ncbi:transposase [Chryseobacterium oncorhynchi]|uniref:Transposase n=1 Tax=Chryseobacterium oncorhynchi TaxID=741074 RepID=A0A316WF58_9FLAO|nr:transposase [Chryseobacterium oncorhynchi]PWN60062.1 transposase [Chryseobacterium oncorhynchi]